MTDRAPALTFSRGRLTMMRSKLYPDAGCVADAVAAASRDRAAWTVSERAALRGIAGRCPTPLISMRRRWFFVTGKFVFVVERPRGGGFSVARVPSS
jgi:hypothetical protein